MLRQLDIALVTRPFWDFVHDQGKASTLQVYAWFSGFRRMQLMQDRTHFKRLNSDVTNLTLLRRLLNSAFHRRGFPVNHTRSYSCFLSSAVRNAKRNRSRRTLFQSSVARMCSRDAYQAVWPSLSPPIRSIVALRNPEDVWRRRMHGETSCSGGDIISCGLPTALEALASETYLTDKDGSDHQLCALSPPLAHG